MALTAYSSRGELCMRWAYCSIYADYLMETWYSYSWLGVLLSTQLKPHGKTLSSRSVRDLYLVSQSVGFSVLSSGRWTDCSTICGESDFSQNIFQFLSQSTAKLLGTSEPAKQGPSWGGSSSVRSKQLSVQYFGCQWCPPPAAYIAVLQDVAH